MKFKKVPNDYLFSKYVREDGRYTIESEDRKINGTWKNVFVVTNKNGEEIEVFRKLKDAKEKYAVEEVEEEVEEVAEEKVEKVETVVMKAFTGMLIGEFKVVAETSEAITVETKKGELSFDKKTGIQLNPNNPKFANRIERM